MLYNFLTSEDLEVSIKEEMLTQLVRDNLSLIVLAEARSISWMHDYLGQRFTIADVFPNIGEWAAGNDYGPAVTVIVPGAIVAADPGIFYARDTPTEATSYTPLYARNAAGRLTNYAWHADQCYEALLPSLGVEPGNTTANALWPAYWRLRDPRDPKLVGFAVDVTLFNLFTRVAPRKIPELRVSLYNQAKEWLTMVRDGNMTPDLPRPLKQADNSDTIRWGSNAPQQYHY